MECNICFENINKTTRKEVKCPYCDFSVCLLCFRRYLLESVKILPDCMSCHKELQLDFVSQVTPKTFHNNEYRKKRTKDLLSQEKSLLPDTQHLVEDRIAKLKREQEITELLKQKKNLQNRITEISTRIHELRIMPNSQKLKNKERKKFIMGCPNGDCRGFLSQAWKCGTCGIHVCSKCRAVKNDRDDEKHTCDENAVKTYEMLKQEVKPCPKCAVPIYKISGCDQMWCVECHTPFSWRTGDIVRGVIHNPHFYQWQREQNNGVAPRVPGDRPAGHCGGELPWIQAVNYIMHQRQQKFKHVDNCHRLVGHIRDVVIPRYPNTIGMCDNTDLRIEYLCKNIDDKKWESLLAMRLKKSEKDREINQVLDMFVIALTDLFITYVAGNTNDLEKDANFLRSYTNRELLKISKKYNNKVPYIDSKWRCN